MLQQKGGLKEQKKGCRARNKFEQKEEYLDYFFYIQT